MNDAKNTRELSGRQKIRICRFCVQNCNVEQNKNEDSLNISRSGLLGFVCVYRFAMLIRFVWLVLVATTSLATAHPYGKVSTKSLNPLIVGGTVVARNELPYQISVRYLGTHICGGSILNENYVLTSANCAVVGSPTTFSVVAGEHSIETNDGTEQTRQIVEIKINNYYNPATMENDIALLKLGSPLIYTSYVKPIVIPKLEFVAEGTAVASGWGSTAEEGVPSDFLRKVQVPIISDDACRGFYGKATIFNTMICAGQTDGGKAFCTGDTGGPLTLNVDGETMLVGISSWSYGCARPNNPGVYTEVSKFSSWIASYAT